MKNAPQRVAIIVIGLVAMSVFGLWVGRGPIGNPQSTQP